MAGTLIISRDNSRCGIILSGRVNFETVVPLRNFVNDLPADIKELTVELGGCLSMDSTCMGVLSMLALLGIKSKLKMRLLNAGGNRQLLKGLGVEKLFKFEDGDFESYPEIIYPAATAADKDMKAAAETVLEAHQTLVEADSANAEQFRDVIAFAEEDVRRLDEKK